MNIQEFARLGGYARAKKLSPERKSAIASKAGKASGKSRKKRASKLNAIPKPNEKIAENKV